MPVRWDVYLSNVNDELASIVLDLGLAEEAPIAARPWLLWVWVYMQEPRPDGLSSSEEAPTLWAIEDALTASLAEHCQAIVGGRITTQGRREFYFYAGKRDQFAEAVALALAAFPTFRHDLGHQHDALWDHFFKVLYPSEDQLQTMGNRAVLESLEKQGDVHHIPREVQHWIFFMTRSSRRAFKKLVQQSGFAIDRKYSIESPTPYVLCVSKVQPVDQDAIDETTLMLFHLAARCQGTYDGWETQATTEETRSTEHHL